MREQEHRRGLANRLLHGAKDLLWQDDPSRPHTTTASAPAMLDSDSAAASTDAVVTPPSASVQPEANGMTAELMSVVMSRPTAYSSMAEAISALSSIPMDEATRYRSAFAVLQKTQQRTVDQIVQAVDVHLSVLESEQVRFSGQSKSAEEGEIIARLQEIDALNAAVAEADRQIEKLRMDTDALIKKIQDDMRIKQDRAAELSRETELRKQSILQTTRNFAAAADAVKAMLASEKTKVQQYLA